MTELAVERFRPVTLSVRSWHAAPAAELLREPLKDMELCRAPLRRLRREFDRILLMASGKSAYLSEKVKNEVLGAVAFGAPATVYFALWTTAAGTDMDGFVGNTAGEVSGGAYDRVAKTNNTTNFASITGDAAKVNSNAITFATATANWNGGSAIPQSIVFDGNLKTAADNGLVWGDLTTARIVLNGDTASWATSDFSWTEE
ncbi:MAG: hypothetical protein HY323_05500 [Betaproteobacteria bacterium]|nr:hypothetical protein [Betaproteobacteria bacterium]